MMEADDVETVMWQGRFITAKTRGKWEYVSRARGIKAGVILAIEDDHVLLVEQYRVPLGANCVELPAGLIGDHEEGEDTLVTAARELEEETGYRADHLEIIGEYFSSPGMVSESFSLVRARGLNKVSDGGGVGIKVAVIPFFSAKARAASRLGKVNCTCDCVSPEPAQPIKGSAFRGSAGTYSSTHSRRPLPDCMAFLGR